MSKISVIVPVYNSKDYLERCVKSILNQTYKNFEVILVDDGATDQSGMECDRLALNDTRIRVFHKENGGVSSARNLGIDVAQGELIAFIDSDDYIAVNYLEKLIPQREDLTVGGVYNVGYGNAPIVGRKEKDVVEAVTIDNIVKWYEQRSLYSVWTSIFKRDIITANGLRFDTQTTRGEDTIFMFNYVEKCSLVRFVSDALYYYVRYGKGTATTTTSLKNVYALAYLDSFLKDWFKQNSAYSDKFNSGSYWTKSEEKWYFAEIYNREDLNLKVKYTWYKVFFSLPNFTDYIDELFKDDSYKMVWLLKKKSALLLVIYQGMVILAKRMFKGRWK